MRMKRFELMYRTGRKVIVRAKSYRTLERRLSKDERDKCLIRQLSPAELKRMGRLFT